MTLKVEGVDPCEHHCGGPIRGRSKWSSGRAGDPLFLSLKELGRGSHPHPKPLSQRWGVWTLVITRMSSRGS